MAQMHSLSEGAGCGYSRHIALHGNLHIATFGDSATINRTMSLSECKRGEHCLFYGTFHSAASIRSGVWGLGFGAWDFGPVLGAGVTVENPIQLYWPASRCAQIYNSVYRVSFGIIYAKEKSTLANGRYGSKDRYLKAYSRKCKVVSV